MDEVIAVANICWDYRFHRAVGLRLTDVLANPAALLEHC